MIEDSLYRTPRLRLRPPRSEDAAQIFRLLGSDPEVTRFVAWPRHRSIEDTHGFLAFSRSEWSRWPQGPLLITSAGDGSLLGSTGLAFETPHRAGTGYVLARSAWGFGFAAEALGAMVQIAARLALQRLYALCHVEHVKSIRVLRRCGFVREGIRHRYQVFPNMEASEAQDVCCYVSTPP